MLLRTLQLRHGQLALILHFNQKNDIKMKNLKYLIIIFLFAGLSSCEDIITEKPLDFLAPGVYPSSESDAISALTAAYANLHRRWSNWHHATTGTDMAVHGTHNRGRQGVWYTNLTPTDAWASSMYIDNYQGIAAANLVISEVPSIDMDPELRDRIVAEAKFLRAFYYFELKNFYGGVVIIDSPVTGEIAGGVTRSTVDEVNEFIEQDLIDAIPALPESYSANDLGRATKWAATALLGKVHLYQKEWSEAISRFDEVINSGAYGLVADYNALFPQANEYLKLPGVNGDLVTEVIFDIQFQLDIRTTGMQSATGSRDSNIFNAQDGIGGGFENSLPTQTFKSNFENGDKRLAISYVEVLPPDAEGETEDNILVSPISTGYGPISGKYINADGDRVSSNELLLRYADVLLMRAEAENELNGPINAYQYINQVRQRAGVPDLTGLSKEDFTIALRKERLTELSFEGHRKHDLIRWGIFLETVRNSTDRLLRDFVGRNIKDHNVLLPIPATEIEISNNTIKQNPKY